MLRPPGCALVSETDSVWVNFTYMSFFCHVFTVLCFVNSVNGGFFRDDLQNWHDTSIMRRCVGLWAVYFAGITCRVRVYRVIWTYSDSDYISNAIFYSLVVVHFTMLRLCVGFAALTAVSASVSSLLHSIFRHRQENISAFEVIMKWCSKDWQVSRVSTWGVDSFILSRKKSLDGLLRIWSVGGLPVGHFWDI